MLIGYARTSTFDQEAGLEAQIRDLKAAGCERIYSEKISSLAPRAQLEAALDALRPGDVFVVTKLDRLARSMRDLLEIVERIHDVKASFQVLELKLDTGSPAGELILTIFGGVAQWERRMMLERQREGIEKAKAEGKYKGRQPTARAKRFMIRELRDQGLGATDIAKRLNVGRASVYRVLNESEEAKP